MLYVDRNVAELTHPLLSGRQMVHPCSTLAMSAIGFMNLLFRIIRHPWYKLSRNSLQTGTFLTSNNVVEESKLQAGLSWEKKIASVLFSPGEALNPPLPQRLSRLLFRPGANITLEKPGQRGFLNNSELITWFLFRY